MRIKRGSILGGSGLQDVRVTVCAGGVLFGGRDDDGKEREEHEEADDAHDG